MKASILAILLIMALGMPLRAQWNKTESVLQDHSWYRIGVVEDGVYGVDGSTLQSLGVNLRQVDPARIRVYGNVQGMLPEANAASRYDDLTEIGVQVTGGEDGSFDADDQLLFYGQGPVNMIWNTKGYYDYQHNSYSDTVYYFLCVDGEEPGLRITEKPAVSTTDETAVVSSYPDFIYHESDEMSPFASGRTWYGDLFTSVEGSIAFDYAVPDLVTSEVVWMFSRVLGRCSSKFTYNLELNNNILVDHVAIAANASLTYGHENETRKMCFLDTDQITVRYSLNASVDNPMLFIDYFVINYWRDLVFHGKEMAFRFVPPQLESSVVRAKLRGVGSSVHCWDVTDPLRPYVQPLIHQTGFSYFGIEGAAEQRFHLFDPQGVKQVAACYPIMNQNLHGVTDAEMLIITPRLFWEPATALADYHREEDGLNCVIVDVEEIYNEFGTGMHDPTAVRDFIRMVYLRSEGRLRYVLLMGKGTHDYRNIKGFDNNFVPTYEIAEKPWYEVSSICSDDYFAIMDSLEGEDCNGYVDLGVGRFPITTVEQGNDMVRKLKHYADVSASQGIWKNNHLFLADNDSRSYMDDVEDLDMILDTAWHIATTKKLFADSYPVVTTPSGQRLPQAHDALMDYLEKGVGVLSYTGHGGVKGLMAELIITTTDIMAMSNEDCLPFVHTATCEFSKFDNPSLVSAGELMFLNPHGGAIAMLTTVRPTMGGNNKKLSKSFHEHVYDHEEGTPLRFGDIYRLSKSDTKYYTKANLGFVLFGDPALRLCMPSHKVNASFVNGQNSFGTYDAVAGDLLTVEGVVSPFVGKIDTLFNGTLTVCLYDKKSKYTTLGSHVAPRDYTYYNDVLFEGKATVKDGRFTIQVPIPQNVNHFEGTARLSFYAYDTIRKIDAAGVYDNLTLREADESTVFDQTGPVIHLYWNTPDFVSGEHVNRNGILYADLFDEQGIYRYNVSIGRDIVLNSTLDDYDNMVLNALYEPVTDDYRQGRIALPVKELEDGTYGFKLKAWDTQNNSSEVEITLVVEEGIMLAEVRNFPNPFTGETRFSFMHGDKTEALSVRIEVFDMMGRRVADLRQQTAATAGVVPPLVWDGRGDQGKQLPAGVYVYRLSVTDSEGNTRTVAKRLVIG